MSVQERLLLRPSKASEMRQRILDPCPLSSPQLARQHEQATLVLRKEPTSHGKFYTSKGFKTGNMFLYWIKIQGELCLCSPLDHRPACLGGSNALPEGSLTRGRNEELGRRRRFLMSEVRSVRITARFLVHDIVI